MQYSDRTLVCRECGSSFTFQSGEQAFFAARGLLNPPSRCPACRNMRKAGGGPVTEGYVSYGACASFGGRTPRQMHPATCSTCGQMTEVPFLPKDDRPVFCSECFEDAQRTAPREPGLQPR